MKTRYLTIILMHGILAVLVLQISSCCFGQDSIVYENILIVQRVKPEKNQKDSVVDVFHVHKKVRVLSSKYPDRIKGRIDSINDSGISLKGKFIKTSEILSINKCRGNEVMITGASLVGAGALTLVIAQLYFNSPAQANNQYAFFGELRFAIPAIGIMLAGVLTSIVGISINASTKHYTPGDNYKFSVSKRKVVNSFFR